MDIYLLDEDETSGTERPCSNGRNCAESTDVLSLDDYHVKEFFAALPELTPTDPMFEPISDEELPAAQLTDKFCIGIRSKLNAGEDLNFDPNDKVQLIRCGTTGERIAIPHPLKKKVLHFHHYARLAGYPGAQKLYQSIRRHMYWPALAADCYTRVRRCLTCARNLIQLRKNVTTVKIFPAQAPLESVAIDVLGELVKTARGNQYLLVIVDRFTKLVKTVPMKGIPAAEVVRHFVHE